MVLPWGLGDQWVVREMVGWWEVASWAKARDVEVGGVHRGKIGLVVLLVKLVLVLVLLLVLLPVRLQQCHPPYPLQPITKHKCKKSQHL